MAHRCRQEGLPNPSSKPAGTRRRDPDRNSRRHWCRAETTVLSARRQSGQFGRDRAWGAEVQGGAGIVTRPSLSSKLRREVKSGSLNGDGPKIIACRGVSEHSSLPDFVLPDNMTRQASPHITELCKMAFFFPVAPAGQGKGCKEHYRKPSCLMG